MKDKYTFIIKTVELLSLIILYYLVGNKSIFLYVLSFSLYKIFIATFDNITLEDSLNKYKNISSKKKIFTYTILLTLLLSLFFLMLSILVSDITSIVLNINNVLIIFIMEGLSIFTKPFIKILSEYLVNITENNKFKNINFIYEIFSSILLVIIAILCFRVFKLNVITAISLLYLSKILSAIVIIILLYLLRKDIKIKNSNILENINYKKEIKHIFTNNIDKSIIQIVKQTYYYLSVVILYLVLSTRYSHVFTNISDNITFIYLYSLTIINYLIYLANVINSAFKEEVTITNRIYNNFKIMLPIAIVFGFISPLTCKVIFNNPSYSIYLMMTNFLAIFILLYDITYENINNKTVKYISLIGGITAKIILIIPLINAFYRMGYNLVYGDIISSIIGLFLSIIINYIYIKNHESVKKNYFDKLLDILFDNILLAIVLIILQFIIPITTDNYFKALGLIIVYITISIVFIRLKNKKRGNTNG